MCEESVFLIFRYLISARSETEVFISRIFFKNMAPGQWSAQAAWLWLFHWANFGSLSDVCHIRPDHWLQKLHRSSQLEFPLLQQIHIWGGAEFLHITDSFYFLLPVNSTVYPSGHSFSVLSRWVEESISIIPSIRQCVFLMFDSSGFGDVLMLSYVVSICAFDPFLLPISFQGLLSIAIHGQFLVYEYGKLGGQNSHTIYLSIHLIM